MKKGRYKKQINKISGKGSAEMKETTEEKGKNEPQKRKMKKSNIPYDFPVLAE